MKKLLLPLCLAMLPLNAFADNCQPPTQRQVEVLQEKLISMGKASKRSGANDAVIKDLSMTVYFDVNVVSYYFTRENDCSFVMMENGKFTGKKRLRYFMKANSNQFEMSPY